MLRLSDHRLQSRASNSRRALVSNGLVAQASTLEAMRTQVCANQCMENESLRSFRNLLTVPLHSDLGVAGYIVRRPTRGLYNHAVAPPFTAALADSFEREDRKVG